MHVALQELQTPREPVGRVKVPVYLNRRKAKQQMNRPIEHSGQYSA